MDLFVAVVAGVFGLAVGSFLNVVIARVPERVSIVSPPSRCPGCETPIRPVDNIPVVSWLLLRGRCRACGERISVRYPAVELLTAGLWVAAAWRFRGSWEIVPYCLGFAGLIALSFIDLDTKLLPKRVVWPVAGIVGAAFAGVAAFTSDGAWDDLQRLVLGAIASTLAVGVIWFVYPRGMGFGDVRFEILLGMLTGWISRGTVAAGFFLAFLLGGVLSIVLLVTRVRGRKDAIPFGPWLALGCVVAVLWSGTGRWMEDNYVAPIIDAVKAIF
jgi:leader peptidase (prepilin peptidase)/N-methyltransferase